MSSTNGVSRPFEGFSSPNYTTVPDELFDQLLPDLSDAELRVLLYIIRRTFGFKRESDNISLSQLVNGITTTDGRVLDRGAGLSKSAAAKAVRSLAQKGVILSTRNRSVERGDEPTTYGLRFKDTPVSTKKTGGGLPNGHPRVHVVDTQETGRQETVGNFEVRRAAHQIPDDGGDAPTQAAVADSDAVEPGEQALPQVAGEPRVLGDSDASDRHPREPVGTTQPDPPDAYNRFKEKARRQLDQARESQPGKTSRRRQAQERGRPTPPASPPRAAAEPPPRGEATPSGLAPIGSFLETKPGGPVGGWEDRERVVAYLKDFMLELHDQGQLSSAVTRALNLFRAAGVPPEQWGEYLYRARAITQERSARITTTVADGKGRFVHKNKAPYYFEVLASLLGLREPPSRSGTDGYVP